MIDDETFMQMLKDPEAVVRSIITDLDTCSQNIQAFDKLSDLLEQGTPIDTTKALKACARSLRHANSMNRRMLMVLLVYTSGRSFSSDAASVLVKLGRGQDALRELMRQKMQGG